MNPIIQKLTTKVAPILAAASLSSCVSDPFYGAGMPPVNGYMRAPANLPPMAPQAIAPILGGGIRNGGYGYMPNPRYSYDVKDGSGNHQWGSTRMNSFGLPSGSHGSRQQLPGGGSVYDFSRFSPTTGHSRVIRMVDPITGRRITHDFSQRGGYRMIVR